jgi:general transcription factor IIIA
LVNTNRKKFKSVASDHEFVTDDEDEEDSDDEYVKQPNRSPKKRGMKSKQTAMDDILGNATPNPSFSAFEGAFQPPPGDGQGYSPAFAGGMSGEEGREEMNELYNQADIDWELQRRALEGGAFWIGAEEPQNNFREDPAEEWTQEEMEMRRLVGDV